MKIKRDFILLKLKELQDDFGGYYGTDLTNIANDIGVTWHGLQKRISLWKKNDPAFEGLVYLGRNRPSVTLNEFIEIESRISSNPIGIKQHILSDLQMKRKANGKESITKTTFYRIAEQATLSQFYSDFMYPWFASNKIKISGNYSVKEARESLSTIFTFSDMRTPIGPDLQTMYEKFSKAKEWFSIYNVEAIDYYPKVLTGGKHIRSLIASIPPGQQEEVQARLIFESHVTFIVECFDLIIDMLIHKNGRIKQEMNKSRPKVKNRILENALSSLRNGINDRGTNSSSDIERIYELANPAISEKTKVRIELMIEYSEDYHSILQILDDLTNGMSEGVTFHNVNSHKIFLLAKDEKNWNSWDEEEKRSFIRNQELVQAIDNRNEDVASTIAAMRIFDYIQQGKITFNSSYHYQDLSEKIKKVEINDDEGFITPEILEKLVSGKFVTDIQNWIKEIDIIDEIYDELDEDDVPQRWINLSEVLREVSQYVRVMTPGWFEEHKRLFIKQTDGLFSMEYTEEEFADRLYKAIGFLGRNFRYGDSEEFQNLKYFIQRYLTEEQLILELKFIRRCMISLTGKNESLSVTDTIGINTRKTSILSRYHGRYPTIGCSNIRSITPNTGPIDSSVCHSNDSEAMNMISVMDRIQTVCDNNIKMYTGDSHTVSRKSAGMVLAGYGVTAAGRICHEPNGNLGERKINRLRENIPLSNKVGKMLRDNPSLGRVMATKKHIYVNGINMCKLMEDFGYLILQNVSNADISVDDICLTVERSNHLKKKTMIVEGGRIRQRMNDVGLSLLSGELILCIVGLYHKMNGWTGRASLINFSDIRIVIPA